MRHLLLTFALSGLCAMPAAAQQLTLEFNQGLVTVDAASVPVRTILDEWAKRGGTKVIGSERISGTPLTLKLVDVPEAKALEVILRSVAGYMAAPRSAGEGASIYDRILVMATSVAPPPPRPAVPSNPNAMSGTQRFVPPQRQAEDDDRDRDRDDDDPNPPQPPVFTFPGAPNGQPGQFQVPLNPQTMQPMIVNPQGQPQTITISPNAPSNYPTTSPFGGAPGSISAPVVQPGQPGVVTRPPGRQQQQ